MGVNEIIELISQYGVIIGLLVYHLWTNQKYNDNIMNTLEASDSANKDLLESNKELSESNRLLVEKVEDKLTELDGNVKHIIDKIDT